MGNYCRMKCLIQRNCMKINNFERPIFTNRRIEIKDVIHPLHLPKVKKTIFNSNFSFKHSYDKRQINSIYFDNNSFGSVTESLEGTSIRKKSRIRWYGNQLKKSPATLEIKKKIGHLSWKELYKNTYTINPLAKDWNNFFKHNNGSIKQIQLLNLKPTSIVKYDREYYCSFNKKVRITIDSNLRFYRQYLSKSPNKKYCDFSKNLIILEIKVDVEDEKYIKEVLKSIPFVPRRFSKYCESIKRSVFNEYM